MPNTIFREKSIERVSSPEQLNDYIRVTNPGIWLTLSAIIVLLVGFIVWGVVGSLETKVNTVAVSDGESVACYVREKDIGGVAQGKTVRINDKEYTVEEVAAQPIAADSGFSEYTMHIGGIEEGEWVYEVRLNATLPEGSYEAAVITDSVSPISFLFN